MKNGMAYMRNDDDAVFGYVQVCLETARADFHGALEGGHGVLGEGIAVAAVRERLGIPPGIGLLCCAGDHGWRGCQWSSWPCWKGRELTARDRGLGADLDLVRHCCVVRGATGLGCMRGDFTDI